MYCQNCGSALEENVSICPYCGQVNDSSEILKQKDIKIQEMEQKVEQLERLVRQQPKSTRKAFREHMFQPWVFIFPIIFVVIFFVFFIVLVTIR